jgi:molybdopterin synthase sulfur carrier subunit
MGVTVKLPPYFQEIAGGRGVVDAGGSTVREMIDDLDRKYPGIREHILDKRGRLQGYVEIFVNDEVVYPESTSMPVHEGDEVEIQMIVSGG